MEEDLALPLCGHHGKCRWPQNPSGCLRARVESPHSSRARETVRGVCAACPQRGVHPMPGHLGAATDPSERLGDPSPAPLSPDAPVLHSVPNLCYLLWGQTLAQSPQRPEGAQPEPTRRRRRGSAAVWASAFITWLGQAWGCHSPEPLWSKANDLSSLNIGYKTNFFFSFFFFLKTPSLSLSILFCLLYFEYKSGGGRSASPAATSAGCAVPASAACRSPGSQTCS